MIELVIFDCDGVAVDSELLANTLAAELKTEMGYSITAEEHIKKFVGLSNTAPEYVEVFSQLPANYTEIALAKREEIFRDQLEPIQGIEDCLGELSVSYCLASSGTMEKMKLTLGITQLYKYFEGKIFSSQMVKRGKPAPDVFLLAADKMGGSPSKCLVIEDSVSGVRAAKEAGMTILGFCGGSHMFDFMRDRLIAEKPNMIFDNMKELPYLIKKMS